MTELTNHQLSTLKIVYIEDDDSIRNYITEFLNRLKITVYDTSCAEDGIKLYKEHKPDILIVDINLPRMNGIDFITQVRKIDTTTRVIITTAYTNPEFTITAIELDITRYLVKPLTSEKLISAIEKAIGEIDSEPNRADNIIDLGEGFTYSIQNELLYSQGEQVLLRKKELELLKFFIKHSSRTITYDMIEDSIWSDGNMTQDAIRSQIRNLRQKTYRNIIKNISGIGYQLYVKKD